MRTRHVEIFTYFKLFSLARRKLNPENVTLTGARILKFVTTLTGFSSKQGHQLPLLWRFRVE